MRPDPPCRTCNDRYPACHAKCECYLAWRADLDASRALEDERKQAYNDVTAVQLSAQNRFARRDNLKRKVGQR